MSFDISAGFIDYEGDLPKPEVFLQWKGTDACFDFNCRCGAHSHFDGDFAYFVKCPHCQTVWQMPSQLFPREATTGSYDEIRVQLLDRDEDMEK